MPIEQAVCGQWIGELLRRIEHDLNNALDAPVVADQTCGFKAETLGDRRSDLLPAQDFSFDLAGLDDFFSERFKRGLCAKGEAEPVHLPKQASLLVPDGRQLVTDPLNVPVESGPVGKGVNISHNLCVV